MTYGGGAQVFDREGRRGTVEPQALQGDTEDRLLVRLEDGQALLVQRALLQAADDDSYFLPVSFEELRAAGADREEEVVVPVIQEELDVQKRVVERPRYRISKAVSEREVLVDQPLTEEHVDVDRVVVNQMVDEPPAIRYEGDTMIVPVLEEVVVVDVRLMVREEIRITRRREQVQKPQSVTLRREDVIVEPVPDAEGTGRHDAEAS